MLPEVVHLINTLQIIGGAENLVGTMAREAKSPLQIVTLWSAPISIESHLPAGSVNVASLFPLSFRSWSNVRRMLARAEVVHVHLSPAQFLGIFIRKPKLFTQHNSWNGRRIFPLVRYIDRFVYARYDRVIGVSEAVSDNVRQWAGGSAARYITIPNGVDLERFNAPARSWTDRLAGGPIRVGMAARFSPNKDHATLLRALAILPPRFELYLASAGRLEHRVRALVAELGLRDRVHFLGPIQDMPAFYRSLDLYVQSSHHDGFSLVVVEAMASGVPVIVSDIPGMRDTVGAPDQCVAQGDAQALAHAMARAVSDPTRYAAMACHGTARARRFDRQTMVRSYEAVYQSLAVQQRDALPHFIA